MVGSRCRDFKNREVSNVNAPIVYIHSYTPVRLDNWVQLWIYDTMIGNDTCFPQTEAIWSSKDWQTVRQENLEISWSLKDRPNLTNKLAAMLGILELIQ